MTDSRPMNSGPEGASGSQECVFCRISRGEVPATVVHQDEEVVVFRDVNPKAPSHLLIIPRNHVASVDRIRDEDQALMGRLLLAARDAARSEGLSEDGYRLVVNAGSDGGQTVGHLHVHLLGGRPLSWPPG